MVKYYSLLYNLRIK